MNTKPLTDSKNIPYLILEFIMMSILVINLMLIIFDWVFQSLWIQNLIYDLNPFFYTWYAENVHADFLRIDLVFVAIFLTEFFVRWAVAVYQKYYHRWFFYPFIHWYDLLGCVPIGSLRFLRLLRFVTIMSRLHRMGVIDITRNPVFDFFSKYLNIVVDEVTDRVVIRILTNIREEVRTGTPLIDQIISDVVVPKKDIVVNWLSYRVQRLAAQNYDKYSEDIRSYVSSKIELAMDENPEVKQIETIPFLGTYAVSKIENAITGIVFSVVNGAISDLASPDNREFIEDITNITLQDLMEEEDSSNLNQLISDLIVQSLDIIIAKVRIQDWKYEDIATDEFMLKEKIRANLHEDTRSD